MSRVFNSAQTGVSAESVHTPASSVYNNLSSLTISCWVNPTSAGGGNDGTIFVKDPNNSYSPNITFFNSATRLEAVVAGTTDSAVTTSQVSLPIGSWSNVIMTFNFNGDKKVHLFINGVETGAAGATPLVGSLSNDSADGYWFGNDTFDDGWNGSIAEIAIWNKVLTGVEISGVASSTTGVSLIQTPNLVGYWHLCGTQSPEPDVINGNNGVLSTNPPTQGSNSPGFNCSAAAPPWSSIDCRNFGQFPNFFRVVNQTNIYDVQTSSNPAVPGADSRTAGAPTASGTYPQNSRTPGTFGPGE